MLALHRGDKFPAVKFRRGQHRHGQLGGKKFSRGIAKFPDCDRQNSPAKNVIHFDLHLIASRPEEQFDFVAILGGGDFRLQTDFGESLPHGV